MAARITWTLFALNMIRTITLAILLLAIGCNDSEEQQSGKLSSVDLGRNPETGEVYFALANSVPDTRRIKFDSSQVYRIAFWRGSGLDGLETVEIDENLNARLYRQTSNGLETCNISLALNEYGVVTDSIHKNRLFELDRAYHAEVADGTQWIVWIRQNEISKTIYCNNYFPDSLRLFAKDVDSVFDIDDDLLEWSLVPASLAGDHDTHIWDATRGK